MSNRTAGNQGDQSDLDLELDYSPRGGSSADNVLRGNPHLRSQDDSLGLDDFSFDDDEPLDLGGDELVRVERRQNGSNQPSLQQQLQQQLEQHQQRELEAQQQQQQQPPQQQGADEADDFVAPLPGQGSHSAQGVLNQDPSQHGTNSTDAQQNEEEADFDESEIDLEASAVLVPRNQGILAGLQSAIEQRKKEIDEGSVEVEVATTTVPSADAWNDVPDTDRGKGLAMGLLRAIEQQRAEQEQSNPAAEAHYEDPDPRPDEVESKGHVVLDTTLDTDAPTPVEAAASKQISIGGEPFEQWWSSPDITRFSDNAKACLQTSALEVAAQVKALINQEMLLAQQDGIDDPFSSFVSRVRELAQQHYSSGLLPDDISIHEIEQILVTPAIVFAAETQTEQESYLIRAAKFGCAKLAKALLELGVNPLDRYQLSVDGTNALSCACLGGHKTVVELLLHNTKAGPESDPQSMSKYLGVLMRTSDAHGWTALHDAVQSGNLDCLQAILKAIVEHMPHDDAKVLASPCNHCGRTPLDIARSKGPAVEKAVMNAYAVTGLL